MNAQSHNTKLASLNESFKSSARPTEPLEVSLPHGPKVDLMELTLDTVHRLAQYGARQWIQDSIAGMAKEMKGEGADEDAIKAALVAEQEARWQSIVDGTVGTRSTGPRVRGVERVIRDVALENIKSVLGKLNKKLPKGQELQDMLAKYISANKESLTAEANRRMESGTVSDEEAKKLAESLGIAA